MADIHDLFKKFNNEISLSTDKQNNLRKGDEMRCVARLKHGLRTMTNNSQLFVGRDHLL